MNYVNASFNKAQYIADNFDRALTEGWIEVYYQPIVRTANGYVCGEEALARWDDPQLGMLNPSEFVPVLESANLVHKLDLFVMKKMLEKMVEQRKRGLYLVPTAVNFSEVDFYSCDVIEEVMKLAEEANIPNYLIAISISEGSLTIANEFVISQLEHMQEMGFQIWLDDYGSGDTAPALLQVMHFDLLKVNIFFVKQILNSESARIIITELVRMAASLGLETAIEGVESKEQVDFLKEIGCTKLQGFYFCKTFTAEAIFERYEKGTAIGFENPKEAGYYSEIGKVNLYDLSVTKSNTKGLDNYFDTLPMAILESTGDTIRILRGNKSFKEFLTHNFSRARMDSVYEFDKELFRAGKYTMNSIRKCGIEGKQYIIDDRMIDGKTVHIFMRRLAVNPVTKVAAVVFVILSLSEDKSQKNTLTYNYIARALSEDYLNLIYVDLVTDVFVEYNPDSENRDISVSRNGTDFFGDKEKNSYNRVYSEDRPYFKESFTKENILKSIEENGSYSINYRRIINDKPTYVSLKAIRIKTGGDGLIIGINNIDAQMQQQEAFERIKEERITFSRVMALSGDFICIYSIDPTDDSYIRFGSERDLNPLDIPAEGHDFYETLRRNIKNILQKGKVREFMQVFHKEIIKYEIDVNGMFVYRTVFLDVRNNNTPMHVSIRATRVQEEDGEHILFGIINIDNQVQLEQQYMNIIQATEDKATKDPLTGVKNKLAYVEDEEKINIRIREGQERSLVVILCDLNGLKSVNDNYGHHAGDIYIKQGVEMICEAFAHSPVYRVGGDEFIVMAESLDYKHLDKCLNALNNKNKENLKKGMVSLAVGVAIYKDEASLQELVDKADKKMYENKKLIKENNGLL